MTKRTWQDQIPGCFGSVDKICGSHALDEERCREMFKSAIDAGATMDQVAGEAERYLKSSGAQQSHIDKQIAKIRNMEI